MNTRNRFKSAIWANNSRQILLGGAGGISSWVYLLLSRSNDHKILVVDPDTVEDHNLGGQLFQSKFVGSPKVQALYDTVSDLVYPVPNPFLEVSKIQDLFGAVTDYVIMGFDNMEARKYTYETWKSLKTRKILIDGRLQAEQFEIYFVTPGREERYEKTMFSSEEEEDLSCTFKSTSHFAAMIASIIVQGFNSYLANEVSEEEVYHLPFKYYCFGPTFTTEIEN